jgi:enterochelin esterase-like enzyme
VASAPAATPQGESSGLASPEVHADRRLTLRLLAPLASRVEVAGDLGHPGDLLSLQKSDAGIWSTTVGPLEPDLYAYRFELDGVSIPDPANPYVKTASGPGIESLVEVPADAPAFYDYRTVPHGDLRRVLYDSKSLGAPRAAWVYTPPDYASAETRYPVLYLLHGLGDVENGWITAGRATEILDNLIADRQAVPMVVVMPLGHARPMLEAGRPEAWQEPPRLIGSARAIENDLIRDLLPVIERTFRVSKRAADRALAGLSMGGLQALTIGLSRLDVFPWIGAMSAAVGIEGENPVDPFQAALADPKLVNSKLKLLWLSCGRSDALLSANQRLADALRAQGVTHIWKPTDGGHSWRVWRRGLHELAPMLFAHGKR